MKTWVKVVVAVAVVVFVVFAIDQSRHITAAVHDAAGASMLLTLAIIAGAAFLETGFPVFSAFMPGEFTVILAGSLAAADVLDPAAVLAVVWPCSFAGDLTSFAIGYRYGRPLLQRDRQLLKLSTRQLDSADATINRYGTGSILIGRFLPVARALVPFLAGTGAMDYAPSSPSTSPPPAHSPSHSSAPATTAPTSTTPHPGPSSPSQ